MACSRSDDGERQPERSGLSLPRPRRPLRPAGVLGLRESGRCGTASDTRHGLGRAELLWGPYEREHFEKAISELLGFQDRWNRRRQVETKHLDRAVDNMKHLAETRQLDGRSRRMIGQDIELLRDLRAQLRRYRD